MNALPLGIVSDEIHPDFEEAVRHGLSWDITRYELRVLTSGRVPQVSSEEWKRVCALVSQKNLMVTALSPGIFKHPLSRSDELARELTETLPRTLTMAQEIGAGLIIVFGFQREPGEPASRYDQAVSLFSRASALAAESGIGLAVENEPGFWCDTGVNSARLLRDVDSPSMRANWDPCNAYGTPERPYPEGYEAVKDLIVNVHAKDTLKGALIQCVPIGDGIIDWRGQIRALLKDRIVPHITIETHCLPLVENSRRNVETLRALMKEAS
jgi:sugar phosphate isomerase/epimerase